MPWSCQEMASTHGIWPQTVLQMTFAGLFRMKDALNSRSGVGQVFDVLQAVNTWQYVLWLSIFFYLASRGRGSGSSRCDVSTVKAAHARSCTRCVQVEQLCASKCASQHQKCSACCSPGAMSARAPPHKACKHKLSTESGAKQWKAGFPCH